MKTRLPHPVLLLALACFLPVGAEGDDDCLICHEDVDPAPLAESVHGAMGMGCTDCHADLAGVEMPHEEEVLPVDCATCHDGDAWAASVHGRERSNGSSEPAATCTTCHGTHAIRPSDDPDSVSYHLNITEMCTACHDAEQRPEGAKRVNEDRVHGETLARAGLMVAPTCTTCHGAHDILPSEEEGSRVHRHNVFEGCGHCHAGILRPYRESVHGTAVAAGSTEAPACSDCHAIHAIDRPHLEPWRMEIIAECGHCHYRAIETYRKTFHGQVTKLGYTRVATCSDCHRAHDIYPATVAASSLSAENRLETCRQCHQGAGQNFTRYDPHADPHDKERSAIVYYSATFMKYLLVGVFVFFGLHTLLWLPRSFLERRERRS